MDDELLPERQRGRPLDRDEVEALTTNASAIALEPKHAAELVRLVERALA